MGEVQATEESGVRTGLRRADETLFSVAGLNICAEGCTPHLTRRSQRRVFGSTGQRGLYDPMGRLLAEYVVTNHVKAQVDSEECFDRAFATDSIWEQLWSKNRAADFVFGSP
jgi:hypothetical protein